MAEEKKYTTDMNYQNPIVNAGSVFTEAQWIAKGGKKGSLEAHVVKGYIREWKGQSLPETVTSDTAEVNTLKQAEDVELVEQGPTVTADSADTTSVDSSEEESDKEVDGVVEGEGKPKAQGVWNFKAEDIENLPLEALNVMAKEHATKFDKPFRQRKDKDALIKFMCSEA